MSDDLYPYRCDSNLSRLERELERALDAALTELAVALPDDEAGDAWGRIQQRLTTCGNCRRPATGHAFVGALRVCHDGRDCYRAASAGLTNGRLPRCGTDGCDRQAPIRDDAGTPVCVMHYRGDTP